MEVIERILVPVDFSEDSERAVALALRVADEERSSLLLLHVVEKQVYASDLSLTLPAEPVEDRVAERAGHALEDFCKRLVPDGYRWTSRVVIGRPAAMISDTAAAEKSELIVIGTMGLTGVRHLLLGSTAERVVRTAPCPVLTVRRPAAD